MATVVEYQNDSDGVQDLKSGQGIITLGYLKMNPDEALIRLMPTNYVVNYLGIVIPTRSEFINLNNGLRLSEILDGIGLEGRIEMFYGNKFFDDSKHEPFSEERKKEIVERMKWSIKPWSVGQEPLRPDEAGKYSFIFRLLGEEMPAQEIVKLTTHPEYYEPIPNGGILIDEDLSSENLIRRSPLFYRSNS
jgi:hypothetical protein